MSASIHRCQPLLGTFVEISLSAEREETELLRMSSDAFARIRQIEQSMSFHRPDSELSELNRNAAKCAHPVSPDLRAVLMEAMWLSRLSGGLFDVTVAAQLVANGELPDTGLSVDQRANWEDIQIHGAVVRYARPLLVDLGGIAKGYAVDCAIADVPDDVQCSINAGGDLRMSHWQGQRVGVRIPDSDELLEVPMREAAVASSSSLQPSRAAVIIDPRDGQGVDDQRSYSVFASTAMRADGLTKIAVLGQRRGDGELIRRAGGEALMVDRSGQLTELSSNPNQARACT